MEGHRRSKRLQENGDVIQKMQVVTTKSQPTHERRLFGRPCEWTREQMNMLRCRFHQNAEFNWEALWNKAGTIPPELQTRTLLMHSNQSNLFKCWARCRWIEIYWTRQSPKRSILGRPTRKCTSFQRNIPQLACSSPQKKDPKALLKTFSHADSTTSLKRSSCIARGGPPNKKSKFSSLSSAVIVGSPSQPIMDGDLPTSQDSTTSTDEGLTKLLLLSFVMEGLRFLRSPFTMPTWGQVKAGCRV